MGKWDECGQEAELLYIEGTPPKVISKIFGVSEQTLSKWKKRFHWAQKREAYRKRPAAIQEKIGRLLSVEIDNIVPGESETWHADMVSKYAKALSNLGGVDDFAASVVQVMRDFTAYISADTDLTERQKGVIFTKIQEYFAYVKEKAFIKV
jgi:hypothetical protein